MLAGICHSQAKINPARVICLMRFAFPVVSNDLSQGQGPKIGRAMMAHRFEIRQNKAGEFVAYFCHNSETIFWTEGYASKASARNAIDSILKNGPDAPVVDTTVD